MGDTNNTAPAGESTEPLPQPEPKAFVPPATQEDLDRIVGQRLARERDKYADYEELKAKAEQFTKLEEANKTELQKATERAEQLAKENATLQATALRASVAAAKGVPENLLSGGTREEIEAAADALLAFRGTKQTAPVVPAQGKTPSKITDDPTRETARKLFGNN
ncbi:capsid assembly scaffolding protein Gp46 family protein [Arthrobacter woluwensis]|uniref:DUF4355 domain-containing protein n=1 Tax=Arthrobacter woluwensis TaxID=156980 RepID=A0A1H4TEQ5_9MICC|nr:DUF4355 domain-containing protein [Arthrobacter woluwensis]SEC54730.1 protein of unknown function [Arthrobacter woluwensis]SEC90956.1 protein of unknown function [Arthrobacter woluwensis]SEC93604.1 protein of unknown function [Arthrobacter woluwensis]SEC97025.1 protein of unknown function [Arthrobacter woluwensis]SEC98694.1 protein of unknown function [Arthrobacter woluwensis]